MSSSLPFVIQVVELPQRQDSKEVRFQKKRDAKLARQKFTREGKCQQHDKRPTQTYTLALEKRGGEEVCAKCCIVYSSSLIEEKKG